MSGRRDTPSKRPIDDKGRFVPLTCPDINCGGELRLEADPMTGALVWRCDGLIDPCDDNKPLEACSFTHWQGEAYP